MFKNCSDDSIFDDFEAKYQNKIFGAYPHISKFSIICNTTEQYLEYKDVPKIDNVESDTFCYAIKNVDKRITPFIIFSPRLCAKLDLSVMEKYAAIAHEVGHIVHYFNASLNGACNLIHEIKADEIVARLFLANQLSSLLHKLIESGLYTKYQINIMLKRIDLLNR